MVCPRYRQHGLSLVEISRIVLRTSIMNFPLDKCYILSLECHGLSLAQVSLIVPGRNITNCTWDKYHVLWTYIDPGV